MAGAAAKHSPAGVEDPSAPPLRPRLTNRRVTKKWNTIPPEAASNGLEWYWWR